MILHIFPDDKFIDAAIDTFEAVNPNNNTYIVGINGNNAKWVKKNNEKVKTIQYGSSDYDTIALDTIKYDSVILHYLDNPKIKIINNSPVGVKFIWNSWGGDIYNDLPEWRYKIYGKATRLLLLKFQSKNIFEYFLRRSFLICIARNIKAEIRLKHKRKSLEKVHFYSSVLPNEKEIITRSFKLKSKYVLFNYNFDKDFLNIVNYQKYNFNQSRKKNILLGNSSAPTNNHHEIINILSTIDIKNRLVIAPLSYGGAANYLEYIKAYATKMLGKNFLALDIFLPADEYFNLIASCSICIMNHYRQNGMGNVIFMLWLGVKVFLSERNPAYSYFSNLGIKLFSIETDLNNSSKNNVFTELTEYDKLNNKRLIENFYGYEAMLKRAKNFCDTISE